MFSESFAGIAAADMPGFVVAELCGAAIAVLVHRVFSGTPVAPVVSSTQSSSEPTESPNA